MAGIHCPHCNGLNEFTAPVAQREAFTCRFCRTAATVEVFPAYGRGFQPGRAGVAVGGEEAACYFHAEKRAEAACDQCGRYVCALCEIHVGGRHFCPQCFGGDANRPAASSVTERSRAMPGRLGFWVAFGSFLLGPLAMIGGPMAVYWGIQGFRVPGSLTGKRNRVLAGLAVLLGLAETTLWLVLLLAFFIRIANSR